MSNNDELKQAFDLWNGFKEEVLYKNRFIIKHEVLKYIEEFAEKCRITIQEGTILFRARIYAEDDPFLFYVNNSINNLYEEELDNTSKLIRSYYNSQIKNKSETGFWGYNAQNSFVPPDNDNINDGRVNPSFIKYLYTAEEPYTALVEVRPYLKSRVNIAEIIVNKPLEVVDFWEI
ncbi:RES domain-containing protein [Bacillus sp. RG28]|uniref:RES domain-containing protein n=1 Tax=Gottfriedia endophytica TaxID=2820819 RepID=A0A940NLW9_9BACI|nr:RES domain-containing protein [Gottfriedia endophytica]MBP0723930.1 RES domain-containing protein [Gottfriedia endophytica]